LKEERGSCVLAIRSLGTWPKTTEIKRKERRGPLLPRIDLKCCQAE